MNFILYKTHLLLLIFIVSIASTISLVSMQTDAIDSQKLELSTIGQDIIQTSDKKTLPLSSLLVPSPAALANIRTHKNLFDKTLTAGTWTLIFKLIRANKVWNKQEPFLFLTNPFDETKEPENLIGRLPILCLDRSLIEGLMHCALIAIKNKKIKINFGQLLANQQSLPSQHQRQEMTVYLCMLDKYHYLYLDKHINIDNFPACTVSIGELLSKTFKKRNFQVHNDHTGTSELMIRGKSISSLEGWDELIEKIQPDQIDNIDLSNNSVRMLLPVMNLQAFTQLTELNLSNNRLKTIPANLLQGCVVLKVLNLSYNPLHTYSVLELAQLISNCTQLQSLIVIHTGIDGRLEPEHFKQNTALTKIDCSEGSKLILTNDFKKLLHDRIALIHNSNHHSLTWNEFKETCEWGLVMAFIGSIAFVVAKGK